MNAYRLHFECTNGVKDTARHKNGFVRLQDGACIVVAQTLGDVVAEFPEAIKIEVVGPGYIAEKPREPVTTREVET